MTTEAFDLTDYGDLYLLAANYKQAGFKSVEIDPAHAMAMYEEIKRLRETVAYLLETGEANRSGTVTQRAWAFVRDEYADGEAAARFEGYALARMPG